MHKLWKTSCWMAGILSACFVTGCDWSSGSSGGFNTSRGAGVNINWSGVYNGFNGGEAVKGRGIQSLTINQAGNTVQVIDSSGAKYQGTIGAPGAVSKPKADGTYPAGAELVQSQINFKGNGVTFAGIFHATSVNEISGRTKTSGNNSQNNANSGTANSSSSSSVGQNTTTTVTSQGNIETRVTQSTQGGTVITRTTVTNTDTGQVLSDQTETKVDSSSTSSTAGNSTDVSGNLTTQTFTLNEQNTQYRLEGTWVVDGGGAHRVDAISRGNAATIAFEVKGAAIEPAYVDSEQLQEDPNVPESANTGE